MNKENGSSKKMKQLQIIMFITIRFTNQGETS